MSQYITKRVNNQTPRVYPSCVESHGMKTTGERIRQAREALKISGESLAKRVGYKNQSAIGNLENRAGGTGGNKLPAIADALHVPVEWLMRGPDDGNIPFLPGATDAGRHNQRTAQEEPAAKIVSIPAHARNWQDEDPWTIAAIEIMRGLDPGGRQAMVAKMREYKQYLAPPENGQALSMAR